MAAARNLFPHKRCETWFCVLSTVTEVRLVHQWSGTVLNPALCVPTCRQPRTAAGCTNAAAQTNYGGRAGPAIGSCAGDSAGRAV